MLCERECLSGSCCPAVLCVPPGAAGRGGRGAPEGAVQAAASQRRVRSTKSNRQRHLENPAQHAAAELLGALGAVGGGPAAPRPIRPAALPLSSYLRLHIHPRLCTRAPPERRTEGHLSALPGRRGERAVPGARLMCRQRCFAFRCPSTSPVCLQQRPWLPAAGRGSHSAGPGLSV